MKRTEPSAQTESRRTAVFATLGAFLRPSGTSAPSSPGGRTLAVFALTLGALLALASPALAKEIHKFESSFGTAGSGDGQLSLAFNSGLAVNDTTHDVYVADTGNHRVVEFSAAGAFIRAFGADVGGPGVDVCTSGCSAGTSGSSAGAFEAPTFLAVDNSVGPSKGDVYVSDGTFANEKQTVTVDATGGTFTLTFEGQSTKAIPFDASAAALESALEELSTIGSGGALATGSAGGPYSVEFQARFARHDQPQISADASGLTGGASTATTATAVQGYTTARVLKFNSEGDLIPSWGSGGQLDGAGAIGGPFTLIDGIAVDSSGELSVYDGGDSTHNWFEFSQAGAAETTIKVERGTLPSGIAVDSLGHFYKVVGFGNVEKYSSAGVDLGQIDSQTLESDIDTGFAIDLTTNDIYVDRNGAEIKHFAPSCASGSTYACSVLDTFGSPQLSAAAGVAADPNGIVYVADTGHSRVAVFAPAIIPDTTTEAATGVEQHIATLHGEVDPAGGPEVTGCQFAYVEAAHYEPQAANPYAAGGTHACAPSPGYTSPQAVSAALTGLNPDTTYHFRLEASNEKGTNQSADETFTTTGPPLVKEEHATDLEPTTATLHGVLNPEGYATHYHFEYGTTSVYGSQTTSTAAGSGHSDEPVQAAISGLTKATVYHYRLVAESECEPLATPGHICIVNGPDAEFTTLPAVSIRNFTTQTVGPELVVLKAELNPNNGGPTHYTIRYGTDTSYSGGSAGGTLPSGSEFEAIAATLSGLQPNTTYHYQLIAENATGEIETADQTFTTELSSAEEHAAESCPNTILREENSSLALPDCRAYEQVSPAAKNGFPVFGYTSLAPSGERVAFQSNGAFAGVAANSRFNEYVAHRTESGWLTQPLLAQPSGPSLQALSFSEFDAELGRWLFKFGPGTNTTEATFASRSGSLYQGSATGAFFQATPTLGPLEEVQPDTNWFNPIAQSADFSQLFIGTPQRLLPAPADPRPLSPLAAGLTGGEFDRIYASGSSATPPSLVAEVPTDLTNGTCILDRAVGREAPWASADGSTLFYTAPLDLVPGGTCDDGSAFSGGPNKAALFVRIGESPAVQLSAESPTQCSSGHPCAGAAPARASYDGASPDGSRAWFTTTQPLTDSDTDATNDLYLAKLEGGHLTELVQASAGDATDPTPGTGADVQGVVAVSQDGTHVSFVATGVLTTAPNATNQIAAQGADNLYLYDSTSRETKFVARLCSGPELSGTHGEPACDPSLVDVGGEQQATPLFDTLLWQAGGHPSAQLTPDGRFLLFTSYARLTPDDTDSSQDIYRYDFQTGQLLRLSSGRDGNDANGNNSAFPAIIVERARGGNEQAVKPDVAAEDGTRSISSDGSAVIFETAAPLVSRDTNVGAKPACGRSIGIRSEFTGCDIYQWKESGHGSCHEAGGCISLVSSGKTPLGDHFAVIDSSGRNITFYTGSGLAPADTDGVGDVYDARVDGGFHYTPPKIPCGGGETCLGPVPPPPPPPKITTEPPTPGNGKQHLECGKGRHRVTKHGQVRCVRNQSHKAKHHKKHKRANTNRRAGK